MRVSKYNKPRWLVIIKALMQSLPVSVKFRLYLGLFDKICKEKKNQISSKCSSFANCLALISHLRVTTICLQQPNIKCTLLLNDRTL